jgi:hypothetical protein
MDRDGRRPDPRPGHEDLVIDLRGAAGDARRPPDAPSGATPDHLALLRRALAVEEAAVGRDAEATRRELRSLRGELDAHLLGEADALGALPPVTGKVIADGQRHVRAVVDRVLLAATSGAGADLVAGAAIVARCLVRQAKLEARVQADRERRPRRCDATGAS